MKRMLIVVMVAVILSGIVIEISHAAEKSAMASFSYRCDLEKSSQLLLFAFKPELKKRGWAIVDELQKLGWKKKKLGNFSYSSDFSSNIRDVDMTEVNGKLALRVNRIMMLSLQKSDGSLETPEEIAKIINKLF